MEDELSLALLIVRAARTIATKVDKPLGGWHGVSLRDLELLLVLQGSADHRLSLSGLAKALGLTPSEVLRQVTPLERIGLLEHVRDAGAPRNTLVVLREAGDTLVTDASVTAVVAAANATDTLTLDEQDELRTLLESLVGPSSIVQS